jgi:chemotaxis protein CheY-P-specific phosphatase CheC
MKEDIISVKFHDENPVKKPVVSDAYDAMIAAYATKMIEMSGLKKNIETPDQLRGKKCDAVIIDYLDVRPSSRSMAPDETVVQTAKYLAGKWGLSINLAGHQFRKS